MRVRKPSGEDAGQASLKSNEMSEKIQSESNYGAWMVVTRKRGSGRLGKASGTSFSALPTQVKVKGSFVLSQGSERVEMGDDLDKSNLGDSADPIETSRVVADQGVRNSLAEPMNEATLAVAAQNPENNLEMRNDCVMEERVENPYTECQQDLKLLSGNKRKTLAKNKGRGSESLGIRSPKGPKNSKSQKRSSHYAEGKSNLLVFARVSGRDSQPENGEDIDRAIPSAKVRMGYLVQEPCGSYFGRDNLSNKSNADSDPGGIRRGAEAGLEEYLPNNTRQHQIGESSIGAQGLVPHAQSVVEVPHGYSRGFVGSNGRNKQAEEAIRCASLGRIRVDHPRKEASGLHGDGYGSLGEPPNPEIDPDYGSSEEM